MFKDEKGKFSSTKFMNFGFFAMAIAMFIVATISNWFGKQLQSELYVFVAGLTGGGFLQYTFKKKLDKTP